MSNKHDSDFNPLSKPKRKSSSTRADNKAEFVGFVNYQPQQGDTADFAAWVAERDLVDEALTQAVGDGWKFTVSYDVKNTTFVGGVSRWDSGHPDAGIVLTCRSGSPVLLLEKALYALTRKYFAGLSDYVVVARQLELF